MTEAITATEAMLQQRERERLASRDGQAGEFRDALKQALIVANNELSALEIKPRIDAVLQALTMLQAEFVAMDPTRLGRRLAIKTIETNLPRLVALHGQAKPATALPVEPGHG